MTSAGTGPQPGDRHDARKRRGSCRESERFVVRWKMHHGGVARSLRCRKHAEDFAERYGCEMPTTGLARDEARPLDPDGKRFREEAYHAEVAKLANRLIAAEWNGNGWDHGRAPKVASAVVRHVLTAAREVTEKCGIISGHPGFGIRRPETEEAET